MDLFKARYSSKKEVPPTKETLTVKLFINNELAHTVLFPIPNQSTQALIAHLKTYLPSPLVIGF